MPRNPSRVALMVAAVDSAKNSRHDTGRDREDGKYVRSLRRKCPGFSAAQYQAAFRRALAMYRDTEALMHGESRAGRVTADGFPELFAVRSTPRVRALADHLRRRHKGFPASAYRRALTWAYYFVVLR